MDMLRYDTSVRKLAGNYIYSDDYIRHQQYYAVFVLEFKKTPQTIIMNNNKYIMLY